MDFGASRVRILLSSPETPDVPADWDWEADELLVLEPPQPLPGVRTECVTVASAVDGAAVPVTISRQEATEARDAKSLTGPNTPSTSLLDPSCTRIWVDVYGAYGIPLSTGFDPEKASLLARGWAVVRAHVRGGGERGRSWHARRRAGLAEAHPLPTRVADLASCLEHVRRAAPGARIALVAHSAGGAVAAGLALQRPDLASALVLEAPFVDVLSAMCDPDLPLTVHEYEEWGDPRTADGFARVRSSPERAGCWLRIIFGSLAL